MNTAPITTWEGAKAYFTLADKPSMLMVIAALAAAACIFTIVSMIRHENECAKKIGPG